MALEHALLVALSEQPGSGLELARRFDRSIGFFWQATHQQIYRTLGRMEREGWLVRKEVDQQGRPTKIEYAVTAAGSQILTAWVSSDSSVEPLRSELALKLRAANQGDRDAVLGVVQAHLAEHTVRLTHYRQLQLRDYPDPSALSGADLDHYLVLRGGVHLEEGWVAWLSEYLDAFGATTARKTA